MTRRLWLLLLLLPALATLAMTPTQRGNVLLLDDKPAALTFARGCDDVADLPAYRALGFNTLLVRMDSPGPAKVQHAVALVEAAEQQGLYVLIELVNGNWTMGHRADLNNKDYQESVAYFLDEVVPAVKDHPNLIGWVISTVREGQLVSDVLTFPDFLREKYGTIQNLCNAWSTQNDLTSDEKHVFRANVPSFNVLSTQNATAFDAGKAEIRRHIAADVLEYQQSVDARDADFQRYLRTRYPDINALNRDWDFRFDAWESIKVDTLLKRQAKLAGSSPLSLLEYARYQTLLPRALMEWWTTQVKSRDPRGLIFAGAQRSYRTLITMPPCVNGIFEECAAGVAEPDLEHNNPHAVDIARRGNRFIAMAGVPANHVEPGRCAGYLYEAALHGAAGVGIDDWSVLSQSTDYADAIKQALNDITERRLLGRTPAPTAAFVYSPYPLGPPTMNRPLYGYLQGFIHFGPGMCFFTFRNGTCYGQFDYLAPEDLPRVSLSRYRTLVLPSVLDFPDDAQDALVAFVRNGGTAVADLSLGTVQMNGNFQFLPPKMQELFGVINVPGFRQVRMNLEVYRNFPRFPRLLQGLRSTGIYNGMTIAAAARALPMAGTDLLFSTTESQIIQLPTPRPYKPLEQKPVTGLFLRRYDNGLALYASFPLYQYWISGAMLFDEFHRDLFADGAAIELERPVDFLPTLASAAVFTDGVAVWTRDTTLPQLRIANPTRQAFATLAGSCLLEPDHTTLTFTSPGYHIVDALPITIEPASFPVRFSASQVNAQGLVFDLATTDEDAEKSLVVHVTGGAFPIAPGSRQTATVVSSSGSRDFTVTANEHGVLTLYLPVARCRVFLGGSDMIIEPTTPAGDDHVIDAEPVE